MFLKQPLISLWGGSENLGDFRINEPGKAELTDQKEQESLFDNNF